MNITIAGIQWGDEGKGKIVDWLADQYDVIVRFQGGNNAGHTIVIDGATFKLSLIPSGILRRGKLNIIANGTVFDPWAFLEEKRNLERLGIEVSPNNLAIAENTPLILPVHKELDRLHEKASGNAKIGTTLRGIGPAYEDKVGRRSVKVVDLQEPNALKFKLEQLHKHHNVIRRGKGIEELNPQQTLDDLMKIRHEINFLARPVWKLLDNLAEEGKKFLFEGAQGALLDIDHGSYPYVTSSSTLPSAAAAGSGIGPNMVGYVLGVCKSYCTRVGEGPFPTELMDEMGQYLAENGREKGTVTGRDRRCGWFDATLARQICKIAGVNSLALTKIDVLDGINEIKIATGYELDGKKLDYFPSLASEQARVKPIYETLPGWNSKTYAVQKYEKLPSEAKNYISRISSLTGVPVGLLSTSPQREDTIKLTDEFNN